MKAAYSLDIVRALEKEAEAVGPLRLYKRTRFEAGDRIEAEITGVVPARRARALFEVRKFAGGGFAGQVYQVEAKELVPEGEPIEGLEKGGIYALKILVPPSGFSKFFRNTIYWLAYQGPFSAQVNHAASRTGVLWQKLVRRGAAIRLGSEGAVADTYATFFLPGMKSYAEVNEWVDGRTWRYEVDDDVFARKVFDPADPGSAIETAASKEYLGKRLFMHRFVELFHEMGAPELARQYEWWTAKSQPNALKREGTNHNPIDGLCAIDFRAGLALLPFVPMSPGDFKLINDGFRRGHAVQFDRGDLGRLERFVDAHAGEFEDLRPALEELKETDPAYRASLPDITHHGVRLFFDDALRPSVKRGLIEGYQCSGLLDDEHTRKLCGSSILFTLFFIMGALPLLGSFLRKLWGNRLYRTHIGQALASRAHLAATFRARMAETLIAWHRSGKSGEKRTLFLLDHPLVFVLQFMAVFLPAVAFAVLYLFDHSVLYEYHVWVAGALQAVFLVLPPTPYRFVMEPSFAWGSVKGWFVYAWRFYSDAAFREAWLTEQIEAGRADGMITAEERERCLRSAKDPYIQKYLMSVAVHICTIPVTQIVSVAVAIYFMIAYGQTWKESIAYAFVVLAIFQITPISPGSIVRGGYVVYLMIKERNVRNYKVAALISFWKYIGYFAFPVQMVSQYPVLARLMAGRYATSMVHIIPVFGEKGALIEHWVFDLFFNVPISLAKRWRKKKEAA